MTKKLDNPNKCTIVHALNMIGGRWKIILIYMLTNGPLRFGQLLAYTPSISKKVLTDQLRELEADGIVNRQKFNEVPPRVEYSLTEKGKALLPALRALSDWSKMYDPEEFEKCKITSEK